MAPGVLPHTFCKKIKDKVAVRVAEWREGWESQGVGGGSGNKVKKKCSKLPRKHPIMYEAALKWVDDGVTSNGRRAAGGT